MSNHWWGELVDSAKTGLNEFVSEITQDDEGFEDGEHYQSQDSEQISTPKSPVKSTFVPISLDQSSELIETITRLQEENQKSKQDLLKERQKVNELKKQIQRATLDSNNNQKENELLEENKKLRRRIKKAQSFKKQLDIMKENEKKHGEEIATAESEKVAKTKQLEILQDKTDKYKEDLNKQRESMTELVAKHSAEIEHLREKMKREILNESANSNADVQAEQEAFREAHAQEISALQEKLEAGNALYEKLQATVNEQKAVIEDLEKQRIGMDRSLQDGRASQEAHAKEISALKEQLESGKASFEKLQNERKALITDVEEKKIDMDRSLADSRGQLEKACSERADFAEKCSNLEKTLANAEGSLHEKDNENKRLKDKVTDLEKYVEQLSTGKEQDQELVNRIRELTEKCDTKDAKYQSLQKQLEESVAKFTKAEEGLNYEATNLRKNVSDLTAQIEELRKTNGKLQSEVESSQSSCSSVQEVCEALKSNILSLKEENEILINEKNNHKGILMSLQNTLKETRSKHDSVKEKHLLQTELMKKKQQEIANLQAKCEDLHNQIKVSREKASSGSQELSSRISQLESERDEQRQRADSLQDLIAGGTEKEAILSTRISELEADKDALQSRLESDSKEALQRIADLESELDQQTKLAEALRWQLEGGSEDTSVLSARIAELESEKESQIQQIESLQGYLETSETTVAELRESMKSALASITAEREKAMQKQQQSYEEKIQLMKEAHESALSEVVPQTDNAKLEELQTQLSESIIKEKKLQTQTSALQNQIVAYKTQLEANNEHLTQVESQNGELRQTKSALEESYERVTLGLQKNKSEIHQLQEALHEARASSQDIIDDLHEELNTKETRIALLISQRDNLKQQMTQQWNEDSVKEANVGQELQERERELTMLRTQLAALDRELQDTRTKRFRETKQLEQTLVDLTKSCRDKEAEIEALESLRVDYEDSQRQLQEKRRENERHQSALENMESIVTSLTEERDILRQRTLEMEKEHQNRKTALEENKTELEGTSSKLKGLSTENKKLREKYQRAHKHSRKLEDDNDSLRKALQKFTQETKLIDEGSVDRRLVNKLLTTFLSKEGDQRSEVLRLLVNILKFSPEEQQIVYAYQNQSALGGLFGGLFGGPGPSEPIPEVPDVSDKRIGDLFFRLFNQRTWRNR